MRNIFIFFIFLVISSTTIAKEITWVKFDFPPYYILYDADRGQGRDELIIELLNSYMPDYKFSWANFPSSRVVAEVGQPTNNYCILSLFRTAERLKSIVFSKTPSTLGFPPQIAVKLSTYKKITKLSEVPPYSLQELLQTEELKLGIAGGRSYSPQLDNVLSQTKFSEQLFIRSGPDALVNLMKMMIKDRVDMTIGYPDEHMYLAKKLGAAEQIVILPLKEANQYSLGYVGCSKNAWGKQVINDINKALALVYRSQHFATILKSWLPINMHVNVIQLIDKLSLTNEILE